MTEANKFWVFIMLALFSAGNAIVILMRIRMNRRAKKTLRKYPVASLPDTKEPKS